MVNPFGEVDLTPSIAAIHDNEKQAAKFTETNDCYELHFADKEVIVCKNPFQIIMKQAGKRIFQTEGLAINRDKEHQISIQSEPGTAIFGLGEKREL